jgi:UPF0755 protein
VVDPPPVSNRPRRRPPARGRVVRRRAAALGAVLVVLAVLGWGASRIAADVHDSDGHADRTTSPTQTAPGRLPTLRILFPEGFTRRQMAERIAAVNVIARRKRHVGTRLSARAFLRLTSSSRFPRTFGGAGRTRTLEGFLFPALYDFTPVTTTTRLVNDQLEAFDHNWKKVDLGYARSKNLTPYDVLIIASMIEEEVRAPKERRLVAAVIYNRLHRQMRLGIDATIRYALDVPPTKSLTLSELHNPTPFNTRIHRGLPPTPITNPGLASIQAAAHPARVPYLYFVRRPDKVHHFFTASEQAFLNYQKAHGYG